MSRNEDFAKQVATDYTQADLSPRERDIADFTVKVTRSPNACSPTDIASLREHGLSDADVLSLVQMIAYFNMSTRMFESLSTLE